MENLLNKRTSRIYLEQNQQDKAMVHNMSFDYKLKGKSKVVLKINWLKVAFPESLSVQFDEYNLELKLGRNHGISSN
jgi:hypothetical protein